MTFGIDQQPSGRPHGTPNKSTFRAREAIAAFVNDNAVRLTEWLDAIAVENPKAAFDAFMSVVEYHIPKLSRAENTNTNTSILQLVLGAEKIVEAQRQAAIDVMPAAGGLLPVQQQVEVVGYVGSLATISDAVAGVSVVKTVDGE